MFIQSEELIVGFSWTIESIVKAFGKSIKFKFENKVRLVIEYKATNNIHIDVVYLNINKYLACVVHILISFIDKFGQKIKHIN